jgi:hypothetical protein
MLSEGKQIGADAARLNRIDKCFRVTGDMIGRDEIFIVNGDSLESLAGDNQRLTIDSQRWHSDRFPTYANLGVRRHCKLRGFVLSAGETTAQWGSGFVTEGGGFTAAM